MTTPFLPDWVQGHALRTPDAPAIASPTTRLSYATLARRMRALAAALVAAGVRPRDRVLIALPNSPATVVAGLAVHSVGACVVEVNRTWRGEAMRDVVDRTGVRHAFVSARDGAMWSEIARSTGLGLWAVEGEGRSGSPPDGAVAAVAEDGTVDCDFRPAPPARPTFHDEHEAALVLFTSGSTGTPHGVVQTRRNIDANTRSIVRYLGLRQRDRAMLVLPLSYCYGRSVLQTHLFVGGSVFLDNRFMFPRLVLETIRSEDCTGFAGVPATFELLRRQVDPRHIGPLPLRYLTQAGEAMAPETIRWVRRAFAPARLFVMYGQTEATARLSYLPPDRAEAKEGSIGVPIPGVDLRVVDDSGTPLAVGEVGNLVARGDNVAAGYLDEPEETGRVFRDGWLWTGDLAWRDADGFLFHAGRSREILKINGNRVSPAEIESVIGCHPGVVESAVVARQGDLGVGVASAFVVLRPGSDVTEAVLRRFCSERLPHFKVPQSITFIEALPRNETGKLLRRRLESGALVERERVGAQSR